MNENLRNQAVKTQQEQQRQAQQAADAKAREERTRQEEERRREEERRKAQPAPERAEGGAYKPSQVDIDYRYVMDNLKRENERFDAAQRGDPAKPERAQGKESPAMQRYKAYEKAMAPKVEEYIRQSQGRVQGQEKAPGRDR